jgi:hypothetical protein
MNLTLDLKKILIPTSDPINLNDAAICLSLSD